MKLISIDEEGQTTEDRAPYTPELFRFQAKLAPKEDAPFYFHFSFFEVVTLENIFSTK